jgi:L-asparaginase II
MTGVTPGAFVPLAVARRSGFDESIHWGAAVALDAGGHVVTAAGNPDVAIYPRSSNKPMQAWAMVRAGLQLEPELLALVCASHDGSPAHVDGVRRILAGVGLDESALGNAAALPYDATCAQEVLQSGGAASAILMNCSGKHAGMLATCVINGWPVEGYLASDHSLQRMITDAIEELVAPPVGRSIGPGAAPTTTPSGAAASSAVAHIGIDGCGAPAHALSLRAIATAFAVIADEQGEVWRAMTMEPGMVGGPHRFVTRLMEAVPGWMAKDGAEGVFVAAFPDRRAVAVKIADGAARAFPAVTISMLRALGVELPADVVDELTVPVLGHGAPVGEIRSLR